MDLQQIAAQLRQPHGALGKTVGERMNESNALMNQVSIEALNITSGDAVLEIGMGNGLFCKYILMNNTIHYTGYDFSEVMVEQATHLNQHFVATGQANFVLGDAEKLPFGNESFHKVFTVNTIYFWEKPEQVLSEIYRVLKSNGLLVISLRTKESMQQLPFTQYGFTLYDKENLNNLLENSDFKNIIIQKYEEPASEFNGQPLQLTNLTINCEKII